MAMAAVSFSVRASKSDGISTAQMDSCTSFLHHTPALRITHQWTAKASLFSCTQRALKETLQPVGCSRRAFVPSVRAESSKVFHGECFVVQDNIDTDQIIPAEHLTLVPSKPDEYEKLGSLALIGLPSSYGRFVEEGQMKTKYPVIIGGANFGCGSSREHAPVALGASGVRAVVAESYARIFFRNSVATGELYPAESEDTGLCKECKTGDIVTVDLERGILTNHTQKKQYALKPLGDAGPVIEAGGLFAFARKTDLQRREERELAAGCADLQRREERESARGCWLHRSAEERGKRIFCWLPLLEGRERENDSHLTHVYLNVA